MSTTQDQQRQFQERIARMNANRASTQQLQAAADPLAGMRGKKRAKGGDMPNSTARFALIMIVLIVVGGIGGWVAADFDKVSKAKRERIEPEVVFL